MSADNDGGGHGSGGGQQIPPVVVHGTCVALGPYAALIRGPSGAGKSDLALRFLRAENISFDNELRRQLVSDDQTVLRGVGRRVLASPPATLAGLLEVRGIGIVTVPFHPEASLVLVIDLVGPDAVPRMPEAQTAALLGVDIPRWVLAPFQASAPHKLALLLAEAARVAALPPGL